MQHVTGCGVRWVHFVTYPGQCRRSVRLRACSHAEETTIFVAGAT